MVTGVNGKQTVRFKGDLRGARIFRNGTQIQPILGGHTPVKEYVDNAWVDLKDVADMGYYVLPVETFAPATDGTPPVIVLDLIDLKNPDVNNCRVLPSEVVATAWNDFGPYYRELPGASAFVQADGLQNQKGDPKAVCTPSVAPTTSTPDRPM